MGLSHTNVRIYAEIRNLGGFMHAFRQDMIGSWKRYVKMLLQMYRCQRNVPTRFPNQSELDVWTTLTFEKKGEIV